ncbi:hypothetical protein G7Z17_g13146 [Cylindrodendrum hubeiense]|uniref:Rab-GAP TBC domain-containing protein n=1 Tax=Cylindrodendrum hubeiense TaxID=595255 RepID=A0A9P5GXI8_9HYPO|nr:hypothetical protein G7Z17_g13146 [Cylindrodendrum hubeiense]
MKSLEELLSRWRETQGHGAHLDDLKRAVKYNGPSSPCLSGCRSLCWKMFLLSSPAAGMSWTQALDDGRRLYTEKHEHFLKFIHHPEALAELTIDPLADDPESPWNTVRQDEIIRAEIKQDVQRLPDEASYHEPHTQAMILDILFMYCKLNPERGGYRQGMHELLAPMLYAIQEDALDITTVSSDVSLDDVFSKTLDATFIEHDGFILFARLMEHAQSFYEIKESPADSTPGSKIPEQSSTIVERSKFIHEVCLNKVDPELAAHLTNIEILPQIFLIFMQQQGGMEALFQGAAKGAKGVLERGEKLGINQAVRDAMGEIKRNINEARQTALSPRQVFHEEGAARGLMALERRNRQLAAMLDETVNNLKALSGSNLDDKVKSLELIEIAAAKVQFVKIYLEDSSMEVPIIDSLPPDEDGQIRIAVDRTVADGLGINTLPEPLSSTPVDVNIAALKIAEEAPNPSKDETIPPISPDVMDTSSDNVPTDPLAVGAVIDSRPTGPVPTRSTLAQSSFSWMLEPDEPGSPQQSTATKNSPAIQHKKRISNSTNRERNAFLFGEVTSNAESRNPLSSDEIFGLEPIRKPKDP